MAQSQTIANTNDLKISYDDLKKATEKFDSQILISSPSGQTGAASDDRSSYAWLPVVALLFITINVYGAIARAMSNHDRRMVVFIVSSYVNIVLLFLCLQLFEKVPEESKWRTRLRSAVWCLTTSLTVMFCYMVALEMPVVLKVAVWAMGGVTVAGGFYVLILCRQDQEQCDNKLMKGVKQIQDQQV